MSRPYQPSLLRLLHGATALLVPQAWHQSKACTLATLSSRVCSLSVRVLILTVV